MSGRAAMVPTITALLWSAVALTGLAGVGPAAADPASATTLPAVVTVGLDEAGSSTTGDRGDDGTSTPIATDGFAINGSGLQVEPPALLSLRSCLDRATGGPVRLLALVLVDESGSLRETDPADQRVAASRALLSGLAGLARRQPLGGGDLRIMVRLATFADTYRPLGPDPADVDPTWVPLDETTAETLRASVGELAGRDGGRFTDYVAALAGARRDLAVEAANSASAGGQLCKLIVFLTDGAYDIGNDEAEKDGRHLLCDPGGAADGLRADGVITVAVGLAPSPGDPSLRFLEALTVGTAQDESCGTTGSPATGLFLMAQHADDLFFRLGALDPALYELSCPTPGSPACAFEVPDGFTGFALRIQTPADGIGFELTAPSGASGRVAAGEDVLGHRLGDLDTMEARVRWLGSRQAELIATALPGAALTGTWLLRFVPPDDGPAATGSGRIDVRLRADLEPAIVGTPQLQAGSSTSLELGLVRTDGSPIGPSTPAVGVAISAGIRDPDSGQVTPLATTPIADGRFRAELTLPADYGRPSVEIVLGATLEAPSGVDIVITGRTVTLDVHPPPGVPSIGPNPLRLPAVRGAHPSSATLAIVGAESGLACVWFEPGLLRLPTRTHPDRVDDQDLVPLRLSAAAATSESSCLHVGPSESRSITVSVEPTSPGTGVAAGELVAVIRHPGEPEPRRVTVRVELEMGPERDKVRRWLIFVVLLMLGLGVPAAVLVAMARRSTLIGPPQLLRWATTEVTWTVAGGLDSSRGVPPPLDDFAVLTSGSARHRGATSIAVGPLRIRRRFGPGPGRIAASLFAGGRATVTHEQGGALVAGSPGVTLEAYPGETGHEVPLGLARTWIFALEKVDDSDPAGEGAWTWHGELTYLVSDGDRFDVDARVLAEHADERLPALMQVLARPGFSDSQAGGNGDRSHAGPGPDPGPVAHVGDGELPIT